MPKSALSTTGVLALALALGLGGGVGGAFATTALVNANAQEMPAGQDRPAGSIGPRGEDGTNGTDGQDGTDGAVCRNRRHSLAGYVDADIVGVRYQSRIAG